MIKPDETANDRFERLAAEFYKETGIMAPGKDDAVEAGIADAYNQRCAHWQRWLQSKNPRGKFASTESVDDIYERAKRATLEELKNDGRQRG